MGYGGSALRSTRYILRFLGIEHITHMSNNRLMQGKGAVRMMFVFVCISVWGVGKSFGSVISQSVAPMFVGISLSIVMNPQTYVLTNLAL